MPDFYTWLQQYAPNALINGDTGETLRPDQVDKLQQGDLGDQFKLWRENEIARLYPDSTVNGTPYQVSMQTEQGGPRPSTAAEVAASPYASMFQQNPDGTFSAPTSLLTDPSVTGNAPGDFVQGLLDSGVPVFALMAALGAYGALGPQGFMGDTFSGLSNPLSNLPTSNPFVGTSGNVPPDSYWSMGAENLANDAPSAFAGTMDGGTGGGLYNFDAGGANLYDIPGLGSVDLGSFGTGAGGGLDLTGPLTTGTAGGLSSYALPGLSPDLFGAGVSALGGGGGGSSGGGLPDLLSKAFPNANLGSLLSGALQGGLGYLGAREQQKAMQDQQNQWLALGAPSRARLEASYAPGFSIWDDSATKDAATRAADVAARSYSGTAGNPFDSQTAQAGIYNQVLSGVALPQLNTYRSQNASSGQLGLNTAGTAGLQGAQNAGGGLNAIGYGLNSALNPPQTPQQLADLLKQNKVNFG